MTSVTLVGLVRGIADLVEASLRGEGHSVSRLPLDAETVRALVRARPDVVVFDGHAYPNTRALLTDLRAQPGSADVPVVLLGPARPAEVPYFEVVQRLGRSLEMDDLLAAVARARRTDYPVEEARRGGVATLRTPAPAHCGALTSVVGAARSLGTAAARVPHADAWGDLARCGHPGARTREAADEWRAGGGQAAPVCWLGSGRCSK